MYVLIWILIHYTTMFIQVLGVWTQRNATFYKFMARQWYFFYLRIRLLYKVQFVTKANNCCLHWVIDILQPPKRKKKVTQSLYGHQYHGSKRYFEQYKPVSFILMLANRTQNMLQKTVVFKCCCWQIWEVGAWTRFSI